MFLLLRTAIRLPSPSPSPRLACFRISVSHIGPIKNVGPGPAILCEKAIPTSTLCRPPSRQPEVKVWFSSAAAMTEGTTEGEGKGRRGGRKRARAQTNANEDDHQTITTTGPTRRSQRNVKNNTTSNSPTADIKIKKETAATADPAENAAGGLYQESLGPTRSNKRAKAASSSSSAKAKPKPVKSEDALDGNEPGPSSTLASKAQVKAETKPQDRETSKFWLMKSEPDAFSFEDLCKHDGPAGWDGVRNHTAKVRLL
ncbi:hypothetical protein AA313_de0206711 [Arthrobotrys entomopaga]|nr:hypothetical protein AA313_de0206711 [Arthrobotrys entomopaga]